MKQDKSKVKVIQCSGCGAPIISNVPVNKCSHCVEKHEKYPKEK